MSETDTDFFPNPIIDTSMVQLSADSAEIENVPSAPADAYFLILPSALRSITDAPASGVPVLSMTDPVMVVRADADMTVRANNSMDIRAVFIVNWV